MLNKKVFLCWAGLDFLYFGAGLICLFFVFGWRGLGEPALDAPEMYLRRIVVSVKDAWAALFLGGFMLPTFAYSVPAFVLTRKAGARTTHLSVLNTLVILTGCVTLAIGSAVWFFTLRQRAEFEAIWKEQSPEGIVLVQDWLKCCGYWNASSEGLFSQATGFCGTAEIAANATLATPCVTPITAYADNTLNNIFSTIYGMVVVQVAFFLGTACLRVNKLEVERFRRIDKKRGSEGGFV